MCRMASEQPQVSTDLSPFCLGGMTRMPSNGGASHYITYDSGTINTVSSRPRGHTLTGWGFLVIRVHNSRGLFWSYVCNFIFAALCVNGVTFIERCPHDMGCQY